jgi:hypothetical protein
MFGGPWVGVSHRCEGLFLCLSILQLRFELLDPRSHGIQLSLDCGWYLLIGGTRLLIL